MSLESAKSFVAKMKNDEKFRKKVLECKDGEARKVFAEKEGFNFSAQELKSCTGELSDEELSMTGGGCYDFTCKPCGDLRQQ